MGKDFETWLPRHQFGWQLPSLNSMAAPMQSAQQNTVPWVFNPGTAIVSNNRILPTYPFHELPHPHVGQTNEPHRWFYCLPRFRQAFTPASDSYMKQKVPTATSENCTESITPKAETGSVQKRFLVFDQSGDQTTLIFSSALGNPVQCFPSWSAKPNGLFNLGKENVGENETLRRVSTYELDENYETDTKSEMREDTEELNALLYSDDDSDDTGDDEVTSTGHSPSTMTAHCKHCWYEGSMEEVASSDGTSKKRKLYNGLNSDVRSLMDTASSVRRVRSSEFEDHAESRCVNGSNSSASEMGSEFSNKRTRKERIRETVSILQSIIPVGKGKDAIVVLDEAIHYLKFLKHKAKELGLGST
ncbi:hypothetical protein K2173_026709 [Erythroxylum novogranatense]|uniref:BHLH domain-containing protein n=1 Tax=Erythroxylum novogranatense TaxID=1862640 RepID=A0AAV8TWV2_9ROSI|nr:hypothetical protein K2173_026709 [Erythroxylum novogranatense]